MEVLLSQELFQNQNQFWENGELVNEVQDDSNSFHTRRSVETDVNFNLCLSVNLTTGMAVLSVGLMVSLTAMSAFFSSSDIVT